MGCCTSREAASSPYSPSGQENSGQAHNPDSSRAAINAPSSAPLPGASGSSPRLGSSNGRSTARPNKPLREPSPVRVSPRDLRTGKHLPWTRSHLAREREAFFHTRVSGNPEVWEALKIICEMLRQGETAGAQNILDTVGLNCPSGRIKIDRSPTTQHKGGVYDERGQRYDIPGWVVVDPDDVLEDEEKEEEDGSAAEGADDDEIQESEEIRAMRRDEKGKGRVEEMAEVMEVRARLSDRAKDIRVQIGKQARVRVLIKRIQEKADTTAKIKIAYMGRILKEEKGLVDQGFKEGDVVNAMVFG